MLENTLHGYPIPALSRYYSTFTRDPWNIGDCFQFTVLRDTVSKEQIIKWIHECKKVLNMKNEFHIADGYCETNNWQERWDKLYRADCLSILEQFHKPDFKKKLKREQKKQEKSK